jgi:hypothetical protein
MALVVKDRVQEVSSTSGTGTLTFSGAVPGYQTFSSSIGNGNTTFYTIYDSTAQVWEVGIGTVGAGTLARTTVLSNSSGTTSPLTLAGNQASVFCTYPAEQSVNLDASNNVSPLGTIASGTWQGTTVAVAYGGTGVTASSGANSVVLRDSNSNITGNNFFPGYTAVTAAAGTTVLTAASAFYQRLSGSTTQTFQLPVATTMPNGAAFSFDNDSSGTLTVVDNASATVDVIPAGGYGYIFLEDNATSAGSWGKYAFLPGSYNFNTTTADFGSATITNATWNGGTIGTGYGGTGLTTFGSANYALYSTSSSALAAGTLPVAAGGTGQTTYTDGQLLIGNSTGNTLAKSTLTAGTGISITNGSGAITIASTVTGATITNDTATTSYEYPLFAASTTGTLSTVYTSNAKLLYKPSSGDLQSTTVTANGCFFLNPQTLPASYTVPASYSASSVGPITIPSGMSVTVSSGARWVVL